MLVGHTTDFSGTLAPEKVRMHTAHFIRGGEDYPDGDPRNDFERYDLLTRGSRPRRPTGFPHDYRYLISVGPFAEFLPGESLKLETVLVVGAFRTGLVTNAVAAQIAYEGIWRDLDEDPTTGVDGRETCLRALHPSTPVFWHDPCVPFSPVVGPVKVTECLPENYVNDDCSQCTPNPETPGAETLVNWVASVVPPPPGTNAEGPVQPEARVYFPGGDRKVVLAWDNISELWSDPITKRISFAGYRVYRAESWNRPVGSIGPEPDEWQLVADLSRDPKDGLGEDSSQYLERFTDSSVDSLYPVPTGAVGADSVKWYYPVGRYTYEDTNGLKNGMLYFYDVTAYSTHIDRQTGLPFEREGRPTATESQAVIPVWEATQGVDNVYVVPNPYTRGGQPEGWDLTPNDQDPTGTKVAFVNFFNDTATTEIYTLAGDLVQRLEQDPSVLSALGRDPDSGTVFWNLVSRNGQDVVSGVYLYTVICGGRKQLGRFVIIR
jgi:hypothetical protein